MANKEFKIQSDTVSLNGVALSTSSDGNVVIPGVTRATGYIVDETDNYSDDETAYSSGTVTAMDQYTYLVYLGEQTAPGGWSPATYIVTLDDDDKIDDIEIDSPGSGYPAESVAINSDNIIISPTGIEPIEENVAGGINDWVATTFYVKMKASGIESEFTGGGSVDGLEGNTDFDPAEEGDVSYVLDVAGGITLKVYLEGDGDLGPGISLGNSIGDPHRSGVVAIGNDDVGFNGKQGGVYIGAQAGWNETEGQQGEFAVAIGAFAARNFAEDNSITLNASGEHLDPTRSGLFVAPIAEDTLNTVKGLYYNTVTKEITYADAGSASDSNVWIQTFVSDTPATDFPQSAPSVEYDTEGNVFALFNHYTADTGSGTGSYASVAKFDTTGTMVWSVRFGDNQTTDGWGMAVDNYLNVVYVVSQISTGGPYDITSLTQINANTGDVNWVTTYDFGSNSATPVVDVDSDGYPIMVGFADNGTDNSITTVKVGSTDGTIVWAKEINGQNDDEAYGMAVGPLNEIVTVGWTAQAAIVVDTATALYTDPISNINWTNNTGGSADGVGFDVTFVAGVPTFTNINDTLGNRTTGDTLGTILGSSIGGASPADDMIVKVGSVNNSINTDDCMLIVKYNSDGTVAWAKTVSFDTGFDCSGADADIDSDGNIYVCGSYRREYNGGTTNAMCIVKFNSSGTKQWTRRVVGNCDDFTTSIVVGPDDYLYLSAVAGNDNTDDYSMVIAKYGQDGTVIWQRLLDNTSTWTFGSGFWMNVIVGSNLAVKNGYVTISGAFGDPGQQVYAVVAQVNAAGDTFSAGDWDFKGASFTGLLNSSASDIVVSSSLKTSSTITNDITTSAISSPSFDVSDFLIGTTYRLGYSDTGNITFNGSTVIGSGYTLNLAADPADQEAGKYVRVRGGDQDSHIHFDTTDSEVYDLYIGDDSQYLRIARTGNVVIGVNGAYEWNEAAGKRWTFDTDGTLKFPDGTLQSTAYDTNTTWVNTLRYDVGTPGTISPFSVTSTEYDANNNIFATVSAYDVENDTTWTNVVKFSPAGDILVQVEYSNTYSVDGWGLAVHRTSGSVYVVGSRDNGTNNDIFVAKFNNDLEQQWITSYAVDLDNNEDAPVIDVGSDGNPVLVGRTAQNNNDLLIVKISGTDGSIIWQKQLGDAATSEDAYGMAIGPNNEIVVAGTADVKQLLAKYSSGGTLEWAYTITIDDGYNCYGADADIDSDGNIYLLGIYNWSGGSSMSITKFAGDTGTPSWTRKVQGSCSDVAASIVFGDDGYLYLSGTTSTSISNGDAVRLDQIIAKYETDGTVVWQRYLKKNVEWTISNNFAEGYGSGSNLAVLNGVFALGSGNMDPYGVASTGFIAQKGIVFQGRTSGTEEQLGGFTFGASNLSGSLTTPFSTVDVTSSWTSATASLVANSLSGDSYESGNIVAVKSKSGNGVHYPDGSIADTAGISRINWNTGQDFVVNAEYNGKFVYFYDTIDSSTISIWNNELVPIPVGFTMSIVLDTGNTVLVTNNEGTEVINAVGYESGASISWVIGDGNAVGIYTLMKVHEGRWVLAGPIINID